MLLIYLPMKGVATASTDGLIIKKPSAIIVRRL